MSRTSSSRAQTPAANRTAFGPLVAILLVSGGCSLVYQVVWLRLLRLVFGASTEASAAVVAIFMAGLGFGGWWFGRRTRRLERPLHLYAFLETGIALGAAASPLLVGAARSIYVASGGAESLALFATPVRLVLATAILGVPTFLMGGTLPVAVHAAERAEDLGRRRVAWLYGINTLGAVAGALLANFLLVESLGVARTLLLAAAVNLVLALAAFRLARSLETSSRIASAGSAPTPAPATTATKREDSEVDTPRIDTPRIDTPRIDTPRIDNALLPRRTLLIVAALVGFVFFVMELVWYRMLAPILGGSTYTMGLILAVALFGIGAGGLLYALGSSRHRPSVTFLATTCALEALCLAVPFALGDSLALAAAHLRDLAILGFPGLVASWTLIAAIVVLPASLLAGFQFPLLVGLLGRGRGAGDDVGAAYAWNTAGAIAGSLTGGFGLLPLLSAPVAWCFAVTLLVGGSLWLSWLARGSGRRPGVLVVATCVLALVAAFAFEGPTSLWRHVPIGAGRAAFDSLDEPNAWRAFRREVAWATRYEADGRESSIALQIVDDPALMNNGKSDGSGRGDASTTILSGVIGAALHPEPERVLVIGLGLGATAGFFTRVDAVERVDVVELEPAVVEVARRVAPLNFHVLDSPKCALHLGDGRELVLTTRERWDLIFSEPSNPYRTGVADLFSLDFYRAAADRLEEGGLFLQWLQAYEIDPRLVRNAYATIGEAFTHVETWQVGKADLLLVASDRPIRPDPARLADVLAQPPFAHALQRVTGVSGVAGLFSGHVGGPRLAQILGTGAEISTDDHPVIEFGFARTVGRQAWTPLVDLLGIAHRLGIDRPPNLDDATWIAAIDRRRLRAVRETARALELSTPRDRARWASQAGDAGLAAQLWASLDEPPRTHGDRLFFASALAELGDARATPWIAEVAAVDPAAGRALTARLTRRHGENDAALEALAEAFEILRADAWSDLDVASRSLDLATELGQADPRAAARLHAALAEPFAAHLLDEKRTLARAFLLSRAPDFAEHCVDFFAAQEPHALWVAPILETRLACYETAGDPRAERARRELEIYREERAGTNFSIPTEPGGPLALQR